MGNEIITKTDDGTMQNTSLAMDFISFLGNNYPNKKQIKMMEMVLTHTGLMMQLFIDDRLTKRERECLQLARLGCNAATAAEILKISKKTVEQHRNEAKKKLGCKTLIEAVDLGIKYGFIKQTIEIKGIITEN